MTEEEKNKMEKDILFQIDMQLYDEFNDKLFEDEIKADLVEKVGGEEAIRNLEIYIKVTEKQIESGELFLYVETEKKHIDSIKKLLDLYNKEKEKNYNLTHVLFTGESDYISKDKINNLFKKYENEHFIPKAEIQELLEKTNE